MDFKVKRNDLTWFTDVDLEVLEKRIRISNGIIYLKRKSSSSYDLTQSVEDQYSMRKPIMHKRSDADGEKRCECIATYVLYSKSGELWRKETILLRFKQKLSIQQLGKADVIVVLGCVLWWNFWFQEYHQFTIECSFYIYEL